MAGSSEILFPARAGEIVGDMPAHAARPQPSGRASRGTVRDAPSAPRTRSLVKRPNVVGWVVVFVVVASVEALVRLFELSDSVPAPTATMRALVAELRTGTLAGEIGATVDSYAQGLAIAVVVGVVVGVLIGSFRALLDASSVLIEFLRPIPAVSLIPLAVLFFGFGAPMRRWIVAYAALWPILLNALYGARGVDRVLHDVARTSGVGAVGRLVRVTLPASLPSIATGVRISASIGLLVAITAEFGQRDRRRRRVHAATGERVPTAGVVRGRRPRRLLRLRRQPRAARGRAPARVLGRRGTTR